MSSHLQIIAELAVSGNYPPDVVGTVKVGT